MKIYPFILQKTIIKEIKVNQQGEVIETNEREERETIPAEVEIGEGQSTIVVQEFDAETMLSQLVEKTVEIQKEDRQKYIVSMSQLANQLEMIYDFLRKTNEDNKNLINEIKNTITQMGGGDKISESINQSISNMTDKYISSLNEFEDRVISVIEKSSNTDEISSLIKQMLEEKVSSVVQSSEEIKSTIKDNNNKIISLLDAFGDNIDRVYKDVSSILISLNKIVEELSGTKNIIDTNLKELKTAVDNLAIKNKENTDFIANSIKDILNEQKAIQNNLLEEIRQTREDDRKVVESLNTISEFLKTTMETLSVKLEEMVKREEDLIKKENTMRAREYNDRGIMMYYRGMYKSAIEEFKKAMELDSELVEVYNNIAMAYSSIGEYDKAREYLKIALEKDPDFIESHLNMAYAYYKEKDFDKALEMYKEISVRYPSFSKVHTQIGNLLFEMKRYQEAEEEWRKALEINPYDEEARKGLKMLTEGEIV